MDDGVRNVVERVVADLVPDARVAWLDYPYEVGVRVYAGEVMLCGASVDRGSPAVRLVENVADVVQHAAVEWLRAAVPPCAGHAHPAAGRAAPGRFAWVCPSSGAVHAAYEVPDAIV